MGLDTKCSDWQACGVIGGGIAAAIAAGIFIFDFYSPTAGLTARFTFSGVGAGVGGDASGSTIGDVGPFTAFSGITSDVPFSVWDLNGSWGRLTNANLGALITVGVVFITAAPKWSIAKSYFHSQNVGGLGYGGGAGAFIILGSWSFKRVVANQPAPDPDAWA